MKQFVLASHNEHKVQEVRTILSNLSMDIKSLSDLDIHDEIIEDGETLNANAWIKADYLYNRGHRNVIADDTGLEVLALGGAPGVYSARYAGPQKNSEDNMRKLLSELENKTDRSAQFRTVIACYIDGQKHTFEGIVKGKIDQTKTGEGGFGYDPLFIPDGYELSFAVLPSEVKNEISHRGRALEKLKQFLSSDNIY